RRRERLPVALVEGEPRAPHRAALGRRRGGRRDAGRPGRPPDEGPDGPGAHDRRERRQGAAALQPEEGGQVDGEGRRPAARAVARAGLRRRQGSAQLPSGSRGARQEVNGPRRGTGADVEGAGEKRPRGARLRGGSGCPPPPESTGKRRLRLNARPMGPSIPSEWEKTAARSPSRHEAFSPRPLRDGPRTTSDIVAAPREMHGVRTIGSGSKLDAGSHVTVLNERARVSPFS